MKISVPYILTLISLIFLAGCDTEKVAGFYYSKSGDGIWIKKKGEVLWSPLSKTKDDFEHLGVLGWNEEKRESSLVMSSHNPFLGTQISFSEDLQKIEIEWKRFDGQLIENRSSTYIKRDENQSVFTTP